MPNNTNNTRRTDSVLFPYDDYRCGFIHRLMQDDNARATSANLDKYTARADFLLDILHGRQATPAPTN